MTRGCAERAEEPQASCEQRHLARVAQALVEGMVGTEPEPFFQLMAASLAVATGATDALIAVCADPPAASPSRVRTLAYWRSSRSGPALAYTLDGTPCAEVVRSGAPVWHADHVQELFPDDAWLAERGLRSYLGVPILATDGRVEGHLAVFDREPLRDPAHALRILTRCAERAALELARRRGAGPTPDAAERCGVVPEILHACAWCQRLRAEDGAWQPAAEFLAARAAGRFTHGICPACALRVRGADG